MRKTILTFFLSLIAASAIADEHDAERAAIDAVLDDFHDAAASADAERYLGHMTDDAVFMGTDEWERWPKHPDFTDYVAMRFADGGWSYRSVERHVELAGDMAWFDEVVFSERNGRFRGTGVLVREDGREDEVFSLIGPKKYDVPVIQAAPAHPQPRHRAPVRLKLAPLGHLRDMKRASTRRHRRTRKERASAVSLQPPPTTNGKCGDARPMR